MFHTYDYYVLNHKAVAWVSSSACTLSTSVGCNDVKKCQGDLSSRYDSV